jgi:hypothetical protein
VNSAVVGTISLSVPRAGIVNRAAFAPAVTGELVIVGALAPTSFQGVSSKLSNPVPVKSEFQTWLVWFGGVVVGGGVVVVGLGVVVVGFGMVVVGFGVVVVGGLVVVVGGTAVVGGGTVVVDTAGSAHFCAFTFAHTAIVIAILA